MKHLIDFLDRWQPRRVIVVGDFMLDRIVYGNAERLSPDAPVPVLKVASMEHGIENRAGGAGNVSRMLQLLRCDVATIGVVGPDSMSKMLRDELSRPLTEVDEAMRGSIDTQGLVIDPSRRTTVKFNIVGLAQHRHPQKMFRIDAEDDHAVSSEIEQQLFDHVDQRLADADAVCLQDYRKGVLTPSLCARLIARCREADVPVLVDPALTDDFTRYRGADVITPNRTEAERATGLRTDSMADVVALANQLIDEHEFDTVVLTLDKHGALLAERGGEVRHVPTEARAVYDVTGAGDMVLAMLAAARANGADYLTAVELANIAAGLEVEKFGVAPIPLDEIMLYCFRREHHALGKLRTADQLAAELAVHRRAGRKIAFTNGCFDIVHAGHIETLRGARAEADLLVLAVNTDASIRALKGPERPIVPEAQRLKVLAELQCVDYLVLFGDGSGGEADTPIPLLRRLQPHILAKGGTYTRDQVVGHEIVDQYGGRVITIPPIEGLSTTSIVDRIRADS